MYVITFIIFTPICSQSHVEWSKRVRGKETGSRDFINQISENVQKVGDSEERGCIKNGGRRRTSGEKTTVAWPYLTPTFLVWSVAQTGLPHRGPFVVPVGPSDIEHLIFFFSTLHTDPDDEDKFSDFHTRSCHCPSNSLPRVIRRNFDSLQETIVLLRSFK